MFSAAFAATKAVDAPVPRCYNAFKHELTPTLPYNVRLAVYTALNIIAAQGRSNFEGIARCSARK